MIDVVAGIIFRNKKIFISRRPESSHMGGYWEFPGGKINHLETPEAALERELVEELGIKTRIKDFILETRWKYPEKEVNLMFFEVEWLEGQIILSFHSEYKWVSPEDLNNFEFPPPDREIVEYLEKSNF
ncbi:MAG: 8-oxo-dGTP diphosphatase MutT [Deltaproteobacteria bacterium]|nr:8-oxo-dGTP diphosphatase MutT [Deltaproteobacteria bacterium]